MPSLRNNEQSAYGDDLIGPKGERREIIRGVPYMMTMAPSWKHQEVSRQLQFQFMRFLDGKQYRIYDAPFDLQLSEPGKDGEDTWNIFQPDLVVIGDPSKLRENGYFGVPLLIVEILSPSSVKIDRVIKFNRYQQAGVQEYWIVDPDSKVVSRFILQENRRYGRPILHSEKEQFEVTALPGLIIDLNLVFQYEA